MEKFSFFSSCYLKIVGIAIMVSWIVILPSGAREEGQLELGFHLLSECILALLCYLAGMLQGRGHRRGHNLAMAAHAMLIYSVLNAAGYYAQLGLLVPLGVFTLMFFLSAYLILRLHSLKI